MNASFSYVTSRSREFLPTLVELGPLHIPTDESELDSELAELMRSIESSFTIKDSSSKKLPSIYEKAADERCLLSRPSCDIFAAERRSSFCEQRPSGFAKTPFPIEAIATTVHSMASSQTFLPAQAEASSSPLAVPPPPQSAIFSFQPKTVATAESTSLAQSSFDFLPERVLSSSGFASIICSQSSMAPQEMPAMIVSKRKRAIPSPEVIPETALDPYEETSSDDEIYSHLDNKPRKHLLRSDHFSSNPDSFIHQ